MDEQRAPNTIGDEPRPAALTGDALRAQIADLQAQLDKEEAARAAADLQANPPRAVDEIALDVLDHVAAHFGHPHKLDALVAEMKRALGK